MLYSSPPTPFLRTYESREYNFYQVVRLLLNFLVYISTVDTFRR